jgi:hypothetical protein
MRFLFPTFPPLEHEVALLVCLSGLESVGVIYFIEWSLLSHLTLYAAREPRPVGRDLYFLDGIRLIQCQCVEMRLVLYGNDMVA